MVTVKVFELKIIFLSDLALELSVGLYDLRLRDVIEDLQLFDYLLLVLNDLVLFVYLRLYASDLYLFLVGFDLYRSLQVVYCFFLC